ncbi:MAG: insulinase family protein [Clostridia bacterium]|nr:insulinase family protein [Clostridia bacterium]
MQIIENLNVKEKLYTDKLENGLTIMIIPKKGIRKKYVMWATHYGSIDNKFVVPGEEDITEVPDGIAHFLEHKMFEQANGTNSLDVLTALGVNANAYTTNNYTTYLFEATDNFYPALDELMDYVQNPYFTDENVEKEKGIIAQEIKMYDDYPDWVVYMNALKNMYKNNPVKIDIAGTVESIYKIDKDILYKCYNTFYNPSNMVMCFCGDFEPEELIKEIKKRLIEKPNQAEIKRIYEEEPQEIVEKRIEKTMEVSMPMFVIGIKDKLPDKNKDTVKKHIAIEILLNMIVGKSSDLYKELYENELLISEPFLDYEFTDNYAHITITGNSKNPDKVLEKIEAKIEQLKQNGLDSENFERIKNMLYGNTVKEFNNVSDISRMFVTDYFKGINSFDYLENYKLISEEYTYEILKEVFLKEKTVISIVKK